MNVLCPSDQPMLGGEGGHVLDGRSWWVCVLVFICWERTMTAPGGRAGGPGGVRGEGTARWAESGGR